MEAIPRERGHGGSVMLPVHPPSLGCMGSAGGIGKDFGVYMSVVPQIVCHRVLSERLRFPLERGTHFLSPRG